MTSHGQLGFDGESVEDPRVELAARALWWRDARKSFGRDDVEGLAAAHWPRVRGEYMRSAEVALRAAGVL